MQRSEFDLTLPLHTVFQAQQDKGCTLLAPDVVTLESLGTRLGATYWIQALKTLSQTG